MKYFCSYMKLILLVHLGEFLAQLGALLRLDVGLRGLPVGRDSPAGTGEVFGDGQSDHAPRPSVRV